ncbi:MAG: universal stress protein [Actinomycetota bacterium]|nr:universal stress protein [Actinomycetota bacterium]
MAYKRILLGTDGSTRAVEAGRIAFALAKAGSAELVVARAYERPEGAQASLDEAVAAAQEAGVRKVTSVLRAGRPAEVLIELAEGRDVGLIVVSGGRAQRHELGLVPERLSHNGPRDVLIVSDRAHRFEPGESPYQRVLIATDGSPTADRAARKGYDLAESLGAPVTMVFVGHPVTGKLITDDTIAIYAGDVPTDAVITQGDPADRILAVAAETHSDLIVVGNKGMTGMKRFFLSSVPEKVIDMADRDVLVGRTVTQVTSELATGEGGIIVQAGEKLAAYVDEAGEMHVMSARCTHLGCTVAWNGTTHLFECPCHGSRYSPLGEVVNGPAARALPPA